jgi:hypothetical protein
MSGKRTAVSSLDGVTSSSPGELGTPAPALVARTVEIDPARVEDLLALLPTDDPVSWVRRDEGLVGVVSIGDVVKHKIGQLEFERDQLDSYVHQA